MTDFTIYIGNAALWVTVGFICGCAAMRVLSWWRWRNRPRRLKSLTLTQLEESAALLERLINEAKP